MTDSVQTDNVFEFTNRFSNSKKDIPTRFEKLAARLGIRHKLIRPYTPRHNGKVERSYREDLNRSNIRPMRSLNWDSPREFLSAFSVQLV